MFTDQISADKMNEIEKRVKSIKRYFRAERSFRKYFKSAC